VPQAAREKRRRGSDEDERDQKQHCAHQGSVTQASASAVSSRRNSLISSRSFAAYSKRSSSAARYISSSSVMTSFSSSSRDIPSASALPRRRRDVGTCGDSSDRSSEMSDTPLTIVSGVIPCSSLYAIW